MNFNFIDIENFLTIGKATMDLEGRGLVLIQGENRDDPSADSNGAGKSSVVDAICWCLFGTTARGASGDSVVNRAAKKGTLTRVCIEDNGFEYLITRTRKPNSLEVTMCDLGRVGVAASVVQLTKGTERETQEMIVRILGCTQEVFMAAVYAGQDAMPDLPGMTDKNLKTLIEQASGTEVLAAAYALARDELLDAKTYHEARKKSLFDRQAALAQLKVSATVLQDKFKLHEDGRKLTLAKAVIEHKDTLTQHALTTGKRNAYDKAYLESHKNVLQQKINGIRAEKAGLALLTKASDAATAESIKAGQHARYVLNALNAAREAFKEVSSGKADNCHACGRPIEAHGLATAIEHAAKAVAQQEVELAAAEAAALDADKRLDAAKAAATVFMNDMTDPGQVIAEMHVIQEKLTDAKNLDSEIERLERKRLWVIEQAKEVRDAENPFNSLIVDNATQMKLRENEIEELERDVLAGEANQSLMEEAVDVFGPAGVRAHILDTVTPFLNTKTAEYLGALSDGNITAVWSTLSKTAKGDIREKFTIEVSNTKGADSFTGLSGGEKRKVRLACAMALQDLVATRATKPINLFIADEVDHALDSSGLERLMGVLETKARERGTVLVISHNALSDWIDTVVTVVKESGVSRLEGDI